MKKLFFIVLCTVGFFSSSFSKTIELQSEINPNSKMLYIFDQNIYNVHESSSDSVLQNPGILGLIADLVKKMDDCNQVQMDVAATYAPTFGVDRANSMALGAFMGCMGYL